MAILQNFLEWMPPYIMEITGVICKAKYQMTNLKMIFNESGEVKVIFVKSKR